MKSEIKFRIPEGCADEYGHVNYKSLAGLYEKAQDILMEGCGLSFKVLESDYGLRSFVRRVEVDYTAELFGGDDVTLRTSLEIGETSMTYLQSMHRGQSVVSSLKLVVVAVDSEGRKQRIPEAVRRKLLG